MNARGVGASSLHPDRLDFTRLGWAFALSIAVHLAAWGGYEAGKKLGLWEHLRVPAWLATLRQSVLKTPKAQPQQPTVESQPPLVFVEVNPFAATVEPPKDAKFYSDKNARAANTEADADTDVPKISGKQEHVAKTEDTPRNPNDQLQPARPVPQVQEEKPKPQPQMGDLALAKPTEQTPDTGKSERRRPRTLAEAEARRQLNRIPGERMKQDGGVRQRREFASLDTRATPFGAYDAAFIEAVSQHWYNLLDARNYSGDGHGKVVLRFHLKYDGTISHLETADTTVDTILTYLCQQAILGPAPYERWPSDMRRAIEKDYREIQFTFYYN